MQTPRSETTEPLHRANPKGLSQSAPEDRVVSEANPKGLSQSAPDWAKRGERTVPRLHVPSLSTTGSGHVVEHQRRLAVLFITRVVVAAGAFIVAADRNWWPVLPLAMWTLYGGAITTVHHLIHGSLGLSQRSRHVWMTIAGALVAESGHALETTHLLHHRGDPTLPDPEGHIEYVPWRRMPLAAMLFRYRLMWWGLRFSNHRRREVRGELLFHVAAHGVAVVVAPITLVPLMYLAGVFIASSSFAVMAGKGPQTNYGRPIASPLVQVRARVVGLALFSHDRHLEHHLYPKVPLPRLRHLDSIVTPVLKAHCVVEVRLP
jgi:fatty acid desaturase